MQIKTAMSQNGHHKKSTNNKSWRVWRKGSPPTLLVGMQNGAATEKFPFVFVFGHAMQSVGF